MCKKPKYAASGAILCMRFWIFPYKSSVPSISSRTAHRAWEYAYLDFAGKQQEIELEAGLLAYTICQTPVILRAGDAMRITIHFRDGSMQEIEGNTLDDANSRHIFERDGIVRRLTISFPTSMG